MSKTKQNDKTLDRRQFLGAGAALGAAGMGVMFAGLSRQVVAQNAPPPGGAPGGARPPPPPEPTVSQPPPLKNLKGKVAYVTASSDGIGLGIARAASNAGMKVVIGYRNEERMKAAMPLFKTGNAGVIAIKHDVTDRDGWVKLLAEVNDKFGNLHLVVNNAGVKTLRQASQAKYDEWDNAVAVNFTAIYNSVATCLPHMLKHGEGGHFVTTASMGGLLPGGQRGRVHDHEDRRGRHHGSAARGARVHQRRNVGLLPGSRRHRQLPDGRREPVPRRADGEARERAAAARAHRAGGHGSARSGRARAEWRREQRPLHPHASGVQGRHGGAL
ncbi:MAG: SDR family NAD(P)-dependent oxidoreductase [Gammaproteobacteria bacterium]